MSRDYLKLVPPTEIAGEFNPPPSGPSSSRGSKRWLILATLAAGLAIAVLPKISPKDECIEFKDGRLAEAAASFAQDFSLKDKVVTAGDKSELSSTISSTLSPQIASELFRTIESSSWAFGQVPAKGAVADRGSLVLVDKGPAGADYSREFKIYKKAENLNDNPDAQVIVLRGNAGQIKERIFITRTGRNDDVPDAMALRLKRAFGLNLTSWNVHIYKGAASAIYSKRVVPECDSPYVQEIEANADRDGQNLLSIKRRLAH